MNFQVVITETYKDTETDICMNISVSISICLSPVQTLENI